MDQCEYNMLNRFTVWGLNGITVTMTKADRRSVTVTRSGISVREGRTASVTTTIRIWTKRSRTKSGIRVMTATILREDVAMITGVPPTIAVDRRNRVCTGVIVNHGTNATTMKARRKNDARIVVVSIARSPATIGGSSDPG